MESSDYKLGAFLKADRKATNLSLRDYSRFLGISHAYLDRLEKGVDLRTGKVIAPTIGTLRKIAFGAKIPISEFLQVCGYINDGEAEETVDAAEIIDEAARKIGLVGHATRGGKPMTENEKENVVSALRDVAYSIRAQYTD
jgi:transcriptional regulator with XRE-family HTH domain